MSTLSNSMGISVLAGHDSFCGGKLYQAFCHRTWSQLIYTSPGDGALTYCKFHDSICGAESLKQQHFYESTLFATHRSLLLKLSTDSNRCNSSRKIAPLVAEPVYRINSGFSQSFGSFCLSVYRKSSLFQVSWTPLGRTTGRVSQKVPRGTYLGFSGRRQTTLLSKLCSGGWSFTAQADSQSLKSAGVPLSSGSSAIAGNLLGSDSTQLESKPVTKVFSAGARRAEVELPGLVWRIQVLDVLEGNTEFLGALSSALAEGLTMVILESGVEGQGGARLYDAACILKSILRGRGALLVAERVDIAAAVGADGVVLSDEGLPAVVARRMMQNAVSEAAVLPLVARTVSSAQSAKNATALEGADFLIIQCSDAGDVDSYVSWICTEVSIPVFLDVAGLQTPKDLVVDQILDALLAGASGLVLSAKRVIDNDDMSSYVAAVSATMGLAVQRSKLQEVQSGKESSPVLSGEDFQDGSLYNTGRSFVLTMDVDQQAKLILEEERKLLTAMVGFVQEASPEMEEISLLMDAVRQLDELFLLVIVGEFNSGKSSVINALLGKRVLKEGVLPTTNEITELRHSGDGQERGERSERHPDGHFLRYVPVDLLKQMTIVDTPGTNVILKRQQRLTEEFVPRADLVLFVLSVDRALTESEVTFLRYIRQWGKKIIFVLNKSDVISDPKELEEVRIFVRDNAQGLLSVEQAPVYPVSARRAISAKISATDETGIVDKELLVQDSDWLNSGFAVLEDVIYKFLGGSADAGAERLRLKLETPLGIGMALLGVSDGQLSAAIMKADTDLSVLAQIDEQLDQYQQATQADAAVHRLRTTKVIRAAKIRAGKFVDSILRLSNMDAMMKYLTGADEGQSMPVSRTFDKQVIGSAKSDVRAILEEHSAWLISNATKQISIYGELIRVRWPDVGSDPKTGLANETKLSVLFESFTQNLQKTDSQSVGMLDEFDVRAAEIVLEQEIREVFLGTLGGVGVAGVAASVLTSVLPNTLEDLLALGACTVTGFVKVWNLPNRRQYVKNKINKVADGIARKLNQAMETEMLENLDQLRGDVRSLTASYRAAAEAERDRVSALQCELLKLEKEMRGLRFKVQNLGG